MLDFQPKAAVRQVVDPRQLVVDGFDGFEHFKAREALGEVTSLCARS
jgi:hypothetical protein